jgi:hypothetical protein
MVSVELMHLATASVPEAEPLRCTGPGRVICFSLLTGRIGRILESRLGRWGGTVPCCGFWRLLLWRD